MDRNELIHSNGKTKTSVKSFISNYKKKIKNNGQL